ncbi:MAG: TPM domain-containing protein [Bdellovibrionales bacterium]|nr:TPM domain-containing protein [Bdellovibrionales bacterium]
MRRLVLLIPALLLAFFTAQAVTVPERPSWPEFVVDDAGVIDEGDLTKIEIICQDLLKEFQTQLYVVTILSTGSMDAAAMHTDEYAETLFNNWGIGNRQKNDGILLLVSTGDRKARIELGAGWQHDFDQDAETIMNTMIIPKFKRGLYSKGILEGVRGLEQMARGEPIKRPGIPSGAWNWFIPLLVFVAIVFGRGSGRYYHNSGWHSSDWGGGGGSFGGGGGFSGGGGASGSW